MKLFIKKIMKYSHNRLIPAINEYGMGVINIMEEHSYKKTGEQVQKKLEKKLVRSLDEITEKHDIKEVLHRNVSTIILSNSDESAQIDQLVDYFYNFYILNRGGVYDE